MTKSPESFQGTARFEVQRRLGEGGMGVVYQVYDRETNAIVALKTLRQDDPVALYRFKQEFRSLADINHPNLVTLHELVSVGEQWFFTMELVDGVDLLAFIRNEQVSVFDDTLAAVPTGQVGVGSKPVRRPASPPQDVDRLRQCMRQLAEGVHALHEVGKLHRDLKPSNVMVTPSGRVVVLDFGLVTELDHPESVTASHILVGTAVYMAPEQGASKPISPASDWYSVGVILYEALTGRLPFDGPPLAVLMEKQRSRPESPRDLLPILPADLDELCMALLEIEPRRRPSGPEILKFLGSQAYLRHRRFTYSHSKGEVFIGRQEQMAVLDQAFTESRRGDAVTVFLHGRAGMGKTALLDRFVQSIHGHAVVLGGRCYERESVPYKALDDLIDSLAHYLARLPREQVAELLPADASAIARLFPVMRRVEGISEPPHHAEVGAPLELRRRGTAALRELLRRIAAVKPVVIAVDNMQWGDVDSASLLVDLLRPPEPPPLLVLVSYRSEEATGSAAVRLLLRSIRTAGINGRDLIVGALGDEETRELALSKLGERSPEAELHAESLVAESRGNPFFVDELVRYILMGAAPSDGSAGISLEEAICARVARMPDGPRLLVELVAVAGRPMEQSVIADAADLGAEYTSAISLLRAGCLIRTRGTGEYDRVEIYHDRIRETIVANLPPERLTELHARLARALEASSGASPEALVFHFQGAGDRERAGDHAMRAADKAAGALAFDRAAELYRMAIDCLPADVTTARDLHVHLGDALADAGRGARAAAEYMAAAEHATAARALELKRRAAEQLLRSGYVDEGLETLASVLDVLGMRMASTAQRALASLISRRTQLRVRGLRFKERDSSQISAEELTGIDVCWSAAAGLGIIDPIHGADFQTRHLLLALKAGEPYRVARAMALEATYSATGGQAAWKRTQQLIRTAEELAARLDSAHLRALACMAGAVAEYNAGHYRRAREGLERSSHVLREQCMGVSFEMACTDRYLVEVLFYLGNMAEMSDLVPRRVREAERRGDLCAAANMRMGLPNLIWLAADDPGRAKRESELGIERWSQRGFHLQHYRFAASQAHADLYQGDAVAAHTRVSELWPRLQRSMFLRMQALRFAALCLRGRTATAAAAQRGADDDIDDALVVAKKLAKEPLPAAAPASLAVKAAVAMLQGNRGECVALLTNAARGFERAHMMLMAAACRLQRGLLLGGSEGEALIREAEAWMRAQCIAAPRTFTATLLGMPAA